MFRTEQRLYDLAKQGLYRKLIEFSNQERFSYHLEELYNTFCEAFNLNPTQSLTELEYLLMTDIGLFDLPLEDKRTLVEVFFQEKAGDISEMEREVLKGFLNLPLNLYEVGERRRDGLNLQGLLSDESYFLKIKKEPGEGTEKGKIFIARITRIGYEFQTVGAYLHMPAVFKKVVLDLVNGYFRNYQKRVYQKENRTPTLGEFLKDSVFEIISIPEEIRSLLQDGKRDFELYQSYFKVKSRSFIREVLLKTPQIICKERTQDQDHLIWMGKGAREKVYGSLILTEDFLILNTTSRFQLKRGKEMINKLAGIAVIHHRDFIKS
ncbi:MAG: hypothetical protein PWR10_208 [Halanaerobiales bacterium]|nr:hypothetical protein [Halanaerobiales bacterium]